MKASIPPYLQPILKSVNINKLDVDRDKEYIIHEILSLGRMEHIHWLLKEYPLSTIKNVFTSTPYKSYRRPRYYFIKNMLLDVSENMPESHYVINTPRDIRH